MSVKKQIPGFCKLYSFYEKIPEEFLDETDVDFFSHNIFDISQSQHRIMRASRGSNKKLFAIKLFQFCDLKTQQRYILQEEVNISKRELTCLVDSLRDFLKTFAQASKCIQIPLPKPKVEFNLQSQKAISLLITIPISWSIQIDNFVYHSDLETTILAYFPSKSLNYSAINLFLRKLSTLTIAKFTISTRTHIALQTSVKQSRAITMCSAFTSDCGYDNSTIIPIGDVYSPNTKRLGKLCLHKKTFQSLGRSDYQCPQCGSVCHVRNILFEDQTNSFFLSLGQGLYIFEESPKSVQDVIGDVYCHGEYSSNRKKCESLGCYVTTPRSIYGCGKCGAWLFVHKAPFTLQEHVKTTKTDKTRFFFAKKDELITGQTSVT